MKRINLFFSILSTIYWNIFIFCKIFFTFTICLQSDIMDWDPNPNGDPLDVSSNSSNSGVSGNNSSCSFVEGGEMDREGYVFRAYDLTNINYKQHKKHFEYPVARSGHRVVASESNLYLLGGYNPRTAASAARRGQCVLFQELWAYNFATKKWSLLLNSETQNMPRDLASNALTIHNNELISYGGTGYPFGENCSNDCYVFTTEPPKVNRLTVHGELPTALYGSGIVIHDNYLYTIGGTTGFDYSCDVYRLNLNTKIWENVYICRPEMRDDPEGRYRHEVVYDGRHIFILGGGTSVLVHDMQKIPAFNLSTNQWDYFDTKPDPTIPEGVPAARKCYSCVQFDTPQGVEAYITGGFQSDLNTYLADIWKINFKTMQWTLIKTAVLPRPLCFHSAASPGNGCMYIFGGIEFNKATMRRRNVLYKMWMTIPKLSEMCWEAITYYNPNLDNYSRSALLKEGIPKKFVNRVAEPVLPLKKSKTSPATLPLSKRVRAFSE